MGKNGEMGNVNGVCDYEIFIFVWFGADRRYQFPPAPYYVSCIMYEEALKMPGIIGI